MNDFPGHWIPPSLCLVEFMFETIAYDILTRIAWAKGKGETDEKAWQDCLTFLPPDQDPQDFTYETQETES